MQFTDYVIPADINPVVTHGDDEWKNDIGTAKLDATLEAIEYFEDFIRTEDEDKPFLHHHPTAVVDSNNDHDPTMSEHHNISLTSQSYDCSEEDKFLESINWDEILRNEEEEADLLS